MVNFYKEAADWWSGIRDGGTELMSLFVTPWFEARVLNLCGPWTSS